MGNQYYSCCSSRPITSNIDLNKKEKNILHTLFFLLGSKNNK